AACTIVGCTIAGWTVAGWTVAGWTGVGCTTAVCTVVDGTGVGVIVTGGGVPAVCAALTRLSSNPGAADDGGRVATTTGRGAACTGAA
ncbi:MAG: hypothetical protein ACK4GR_06450, partial [bacterium]